MLSDGLDAYRQWILAYTIEGCAIQQGKNDEILLTSTAAKGEVHFYEIGESTVVELRLEAAQGDDTLFFLHFEFEDLHRAQELFEEMATVLVKHLTMEEHHVLLCCTCGVTTTFFASKLNEASAERGLGFDFCAKPIEEAMQVGAEFEAVLLAPQVGHKLREVRAALPGILVIEIPGVLYGAYDADGTIRLLMDSLHHARRRAEKDLRFARDFDQTKSVLGVSYVYRADEPTLSYVVLDKGKETRSGMLVRGSFDAENVLEYLFLTLRLAGYTPESFDAVGIAMPSRSAHEDDPKLRAELAAKMSERWGLPVYVDTNAVAAATGCYVCQSEWDNVLFHAQPIGAVRCDQGYVFGGKPYVGYNGFAGNLQYLAKRFSLSLDLEEAPWRYDGVLELVSCYIGASICTVAPQAVFVWCDFMPTMDRLREALEEFLPPDKIPELVSVANFDQLALMGELSLCLQRLVRLG